MKFYFPDSQDQVSPGFDFLTEDYSPYRVRQRDDRYAHELLDPSPYDGLLVSKAIVDGSVRGAGKYSEAQRSRLYRYGVRKFFRLPDRTSTLGDCGAFNYVDEHRPPYSVAEVADFYELCNFDEGVSVDHVILGYDRRAPLDGAPPEWLERRQISLELAEAFIWECERRGRPFTPLGAAQGWSPESYADSVQRLQDMGYSRIALGGMVPLKTADVLECLRAIDVIRKADTQLHLLGVTRFDAMPQFTALGVATFDSTSPFRQAFMDDRDNYHTEDGHYTALRVPQVDANPTLKRRILAGKVEQRTAVRLEQLCLTLLRATDEDESKVGTALSALRDYEALVQPKKTYMPEYERTLDARPWKRCGCQMCQKHGIEIAIFRGTERNKRRGFHNLAVLGRRVRGLAAGADDRTTQWPTSTT